MTILLPEITKAQTLGESALRYAEQGLPVLPLHHPSGGGCSCRRTGCSSAAKHPRIAGGLTKATVDPQQIRSWWDAHPQANIGLATETLFVVDVDPRHGGGRSLEKLLAEGDFGAVKVIGTGGGGLHFYYAMPADLDIRCSTNRLGPGIDIRGRGGYVVAPPSIHQSGNRYQTDDHGELALPPDWLTAKILGGSSPAQRRPRRQEASTTGVPAPLAQQTQAVASAPEGSRNDTLNRAAYQLGLLVAGGRLDEERVVTSLLGAASECGLPEAEAARTIESGLAAGISAPAPGGGPDETWGHDDLGNGRRFAEDHGDRVRWCDPDRGWLVYNGRHWEPDRLLGAVALAKDTAEQIHLEADPEDDVARKNARRLTTKAGLTAMLECAKSEPPLPVLPEAFDNDPWTLNVLNGTLDLRTGDLRQHDPADLMAKMAPVTFDAAAVAPTWGKFLDRVIPDLDTRAYVRRAVGLSLTGDSRAQSLFLAYGHGANGKTTFLETLRAMLGPYSQQMPRDTLGTKRQGGVPNDLARMRGVRFLSLSETNEGTPLDEATVKALTGSDTISARHLYQEFFEFTPVAKPWLATNHLPIIRGHDEGIWRRLKVVPFLVTIPEGERDGGLLDDLKGELSGVLNWALFGLRDWMTDFELRPSRQVLEAGAEYRQNSDVLGQWIDVRLETDVDATTGATALYDDYERYCTHSHLKPMSLPAWSQKMVERGHEKGKDSLTRRSIYRGLRIRHGRL